MTYDELRRRQRIGLVLLSSDRALFEHFTPHIHSKRSGKRGRHPKHDQNAVKVASRKVISGWIVVGNGIFTIWARNRMGWKRDTHARQQAGKAGHSKPTHSINREKRTHLQLHSMRVTATLQSRIYKK
jgi:hypothetical protein